MFSRLLRRNAKEAFVDLFTPFRVKLMPIRHVGAGAAGGGGGGAGGAAGGGGDGEPPSNRAASLLTQPQPKPPTPQLDMNSWLKNWRIEKNKTLNLGAFDMQPSSLKILLDSASKDTIEELFRKENQNEPALANIFYNDLRKLFGLADGASTGAGPVPAPFVPATAAPALAPPLPAPAPLALSPPALTPATTWPVPTPVSPQEAIADLSQDLNRVYRYHSQRMPDGFGYIPSAGPLRNLFFGVNKALGAIRRGTYLSDLVEYEKRAGTILEAVNHRQNETIPICAAVKRAKEEHPFFVAVNGSSGTGKSQSAFLLDGPVFYLHLTEVDDKSQKFYQTVQHISNLLIACIKADIYFLSAYYLDTLSSKQTNITKGIIHDIATSEDMITLSTCGFFIALLKHVSDYLLNTTADNGTTSVGKFIHAAQSFQPTEESIQPATIPNLRNALAEFYRTTNMRDLVVVLDETPSLVDHSSYEEGRPRFVSFIRNLLLHVGAIPVLMGTDSSLVGIISRIPSFATGSRRGDLHTPWVLAVTEQPPTVLECFADYKQKQKQIYQDNMDAIAKMPPGFRDYLAQQLQDSRPMVAELVHECLSAYMVGENPTAFSVLKQLMAHIRERIKESKGDKLGSHYGILSHLQMLSSTGKWVHRAGELTNSVALSSSTTAVDCHFATPHFNSGGTEKFAVGQLNEIGGVDKLVVVINNKDEEMKAGFSFPFKEHLFFWALADPSVCLGENSMTTVLSGLYLVNQAGFTVNTSEAVCSISAMLSGALRENSPEEGIDMNIFIERFAYHVCGVTMNNKSVSQLVFCCAGKRRIPYLNILPPDTAARMKIWHQMQDFGFPCGTYTCTPNDAMIDGAIITHHANKKRQQGVPDPWLAGKEARLQDLNVAAVFAAKRKNMEMSTMWDIFSNMRKYHTAELFVIMTPNFTDDIRSSLQSQFEKLKKSDATVKWLNESQWMLVRPSNSQEEQVEFLNTFPHDKPSKRLILFLEVNRFKDY